jgi:hypothetical protein
VDQEDAGLAFPPGLQQPGVDERRACLQYDHTVRGRDPVDVRCRQGHLVDGARVAAALRLVAVLMGDDHPAPGRACPVPPVRPGVKGQVVAVNRGDEFCIGDRGIDVSYGLHKGSSLGLSGSGSRAVAAVPGHAAAQVVYGGDEARLAGMTEKRAPARNRGEVKRPRDGPGHAVATQQA